MGIFSCFKTLLTSNHWPTFLLICWPHWFVDPVYLWRKSVLVIHIANWMMLSVSMCFTGRKLSQWMFKIPVLGIRCLSLKPLWNKVEEGTGHKSWDRNWWQRALGSRNLGSWKPAFVSKQELFLRTFYSCLTQLVLRLSWNSIYWPNFSHAHSYPTMRPGNGSGVPTGRRMDDGQLQKDKCLLAEGQGLWGGR